MSDLIERQAAIDLCDWYDNPSMHDDLEKLPSAQPERKKGKWIPHSEMSREYIGTVLIFVEYDYWFCDACGYRVEEGQPMYNYCPNCGSYNGGEHNG